MTPKTVPKMSNLPTVRLILRPGQRGTKKLMEEYGDRFVCVRYRYDPIRKRRLKTVELIVEKMHRKPESYEGVVPDIRTGIRIDIQETELRRVVKEAGGKWNAVHKVWELPLSTIFELDLENRIVDTKHLKKHL